MKKIIYTGKFKDVNYEELLTIQSNHLLKIKKLQTKFDENPCKKTAKILSDAKNNELDEIKSEIHRRPEYQKAEAQSFYHLVNECSTLLSVATVCEDSRINDSTKEMIVAAIEEEAKYTTNRINNL